MLPVVAVCKLTLSGEPRPVYSILCDSPTLLPPSGKTAFCTQLDFNNLSTENSSEMQRERASERAGAYPLCCLSKQVMQCTYVPRRPCSPTNTMQQKCISALTDKRKEVDRRRMEMKREINEGSHLRKCSSDGDAGLTVN